MSSQSMNNPSIVTDNKQSTNSTSVQSLSTNTSSQVCSVYYETLINKFNLDEFDLCKACNIQVAFHHHDPALLISTKHSPQNLNLNLSPNSYYNSSYTSGVRTILPKWKVDYKSVKPFLDRCQQVFIADNVDPQYWARLLLRAVEDVDESSWIKLNIVDKNLTWKEAQEAFTKHFEIYSYSAQLVRDYEHIKQHTKQSVQEYSHKFNRLCIELGYDESNPLVIQHYLNGLTPERHASYKKQLALVKIAIGDVSKFTSSLEEVIKLTSELEVADLNSQVQHHHGDNKSHPSNNNNNNQGKKKVCANHPNSTSHTTAECSFTKAGSKSTSTNSTTTTANNNNHNYTKSHSNSDAAKKKPIKCHICGGPHYANDPSCPKHSDRTTRGAATNATAATPNTNTTITTEVKTANLQQRSATVSNCNPIDRTLPTDIFIPEHKNVMFLVVDKVYNTLVDTGSSFSSIDDSICNELKLAITPPPADKLRIGLADATSSIERVGTVLLDSITVLFPSTERNVCSLNHRFEVMKLRDPHKDYHFVIGADLIPLLFPTGIPLCYVPPASSTNGKPIVVSRAVYHVEELTADIGYEELPSLEQPNRPVASTPKELEEYYSAHRNSLLQKLAEPLAINEKITGFCNLPESIVKLEIDPSQENSLYTKQYPIAQKLREPADQVIQRWLKSGKICLAPPGCKYNNPITIAPKKDENGVWTGIRVCLDVRKLNKALIVNDKFPIPNIRKALESFAGNLVFGEFDLAEAFLQFELHPYSRPYTAFTWYDQQYMFVGCPYGVLLMTAHFQRIMRRIFSDMSFCLAFVDNIPFASKTWELHYEHALMIITRLTQCNLRLKQSWHIGHAELRCLGHILNSKGTDKDPDKLNAVRNWPLPSTGSGLASFLGLCSFLRNHVRHYAELSGPLEELKQLKELTWNDTLIHHFEMVKAAVCSAPILTFPDFDRPFHIATDASWTGVGGVLFQPDADEHITSSNIVAICSKKLNTDQQRWSAYKKELFGIVYSLRKFHTYVWGRTDLVLHTDHKPLTYMFSSTQLSPALQQWLDTLLDYSFDIRHRDGILNVIPDQLSRMFCSAYADAPAWGCKDLASYTSHPLPPQDSIRLADFLEEGKGESSSDNTLSADSDSNIINNPVNLAIELEKRGKQSPSTEAERIELIQREHSFGHFGREAIFKQLFNKGYWWPSIRKEIDIEIKNCDPCTRFVVVKSGFHPAQFITSSGPAEHIQIDTSVHLPESPDGYKALLVCIDVFTGFVFLRPLRDTTAETVTRKLWKIFCTIGFPKILQSDNGSEFVNDILRSLVKITGIEHRFISAYNPRADGKVERSIGTCMMIIKKLLHGTNKHWPLFVPFAQITFNNKISSLTSSSPFSLMFGRELNELKDYSNEDKPTLISLDDWKSHQEKIVSLIYPAISDRIQSGKDKLVQTLNKNRRLLSPQSFPIGSTVMLIDPVRENKFEPKYIGPYIIVRRARNGGYVLKDATGDLLDRHVPADKLKLVSKTKRKKDEEKPVYVVNKILAHRGSPGAYEYFVDWKDYSAEDRSWVHASNFLDDTIIKEYWKSFSPQQQ
jgi:hypothetical protein